MFCSLTATLYRSATSTTSYNVTVDWLTEPLLGWQSTTAAARQQRQPRTERSCLRSLNCAFGKTTTLTRSVIKGLFCFILLDRFSALIRWIFFLRWSQKSQSTIRLSEMMLQGSVIVSIRTIPALDVSMKRR